MIEEFLYSFRTGDTGSRAIDTAEKGAVLTMPNFQVTFHRNGWFKLNFHRMRPNFSDGQIHRWRAQIGPIEIRGWRNFVALTGTPLSGKGNHAD